MENAPIIFRHVDVYNTIIEHFYNTFDHRNSVNKKSLEDWFLTPPRFTTIRVNSLLSSVEEVLGTVKKSLNDVASIRGQVPPQVWSIPSLPELLILDPWTPQSHSSQSAQREVVVDAACGAAVLRGSDVFAPGVLALPSGTQEGEEVRVYADTAGLCLRGLSSPYHADGKTYLGNGVMRMSRKQLFQNDLHPKGVAVEMTEPASNVASVKVPPHLGLMQNLPSVVCGRVLDPQPGEHVIDLCAAPGHKTTHLAALMRNQGVLVALDKIARKVEGLKTLCKAMGADIVQAFAHDATRSVSTEASYTWEPPFRPSTFDRVLLDAPCSALGQRPQLGSSVTLKQINSHPKLQRKLFHAAVELLKPGGTLVYSTCSTTVEENEDVISWALGRYPHLDLVPALPLLGRTGIQSTLTEAQCRMVQRFGPPIGTSPEQDTIGFFIAKFTKQS